MKKFKSWLLLILAAIMAFTIPVSAACNTDEEEPPYVAPPAVTTSLLSIELDTKRVKKDFFLGDNFTSNNLVVTATTQRSDSDTPVTRDVTASAKIDSSSFRRTKVGAYEIKVSYTLGTVTKSDSYTVTVSDIELTLNLGDFTTVYLVNSELDSFNEITATATTVRPGTDDVTEDVTADVVWNTEAVDKTKEGEYPVTATYETPDGVRRSASFNVSYVESREGLNVSLRSGVTDTIILDATTTSATIDISQIEVRKVDEWGKLIEGSAGVVTGYTTRLYKEASLIPAPSSGTQYTNLSSGTYQIWVEKESDTNPGYTLSGFALIYVVEDLVAGSFKKTSINDTAFRLGVDTLSRNWKYEVQLSSSGVKTLTAADVSVTGIDCLTETTGSTTRNAIVSYTYYDAKGVAKIQRITVPYTVKKDASQVLETNSYSYSAFNVGTDSRIPLTSADFVGVNAFLSVGPNATSVDARPATDSGIIEIKGEALQVTFKGVGTLEISARSTGESKHSNIGLKDKDGNFLAGIISNNAENAFELDYADKGVMYDVSGSNKAVPTIKFIVYEPGTYTIFNYNLDPEGSGTYNDYTRLYSIVKTDVYDNTARTATSTAFRSVGKYSEINLYNEEV